MLVVLTYAPKMNQMYVLDAVTVFELFTLRLQGEIFLFNFLQVNSETTTNEYTLHSNFTTLCKHTYWKLALSSWCYLDLKYSNA